MSVECLLDTNVLVYAAADSGAVEAGLGTGVDREGSFLFSEKEPENRTPSKKQPQNHKNVRNTDNHHKNIRKSMWPHFPVSRPELSSNPCINVKYMIH